jgi:hypothetical protein
MRYNPVRATAGLGAVVDVTVLADVEPLATHPAAGQSLSDVNQAVTSSGR